MKATQFKTLTTKATITNTKTLTRATFTSKAAAKKLSRALDKAEVKHTMKDEYTVSLRTSFIDDYSDLAAAIIGDKKPTAKDKKPAEKGRFEIKGTRKGKRFTEYADTLKAAMIKLNIRDTATIVDAGMCKRMIAAKFGCVNPNNGRAIKGYSWFVLDSYKKSLGEFDKVGSNGKGEKREFQPLKIENSWEVRTFFIGKTKIATEGKTKEVDVSYKGGVSRLQCRWADGHTVVGDHGHNYGVNFKMLEFKFELLGNTVWIPAEQLKGLKLDVSQFKKFKEKSESDKKSKGRKVGAMSKPKRKSK